MPQGRGDSSVDDGLQSCCPIHFAHKALQLTWSVACERGIHCWDRVRDL